MKITSIDVFDFAKCLNYEDCAPICIRINTDAGICGGTGICEGDKRGDPCGLEYGAG